MGKLVMMPFFGALAMNRLQVMRFLQLESWLALRYSMIEMIVAEGLGNPGLASTCFMSMFFSCN